MIKSLKIRDFKSILEVELSLDPVTVLVGRSGTGKSNIVQALRFIRNFLLGGQDEAVNFEGGWDGIVPVGESHPEIEITVTFLLPGEEEAYTYSILFGCPNGQKYPGQISLRAESLTLGQEVMFSRTCGANNQWSWQKPPIATSAVLGSSGPVIGMLPSLQRVVFAYAGLSSGIGYYHFPSTTLKENTGLDQRMKFLQSVPGLADSAHNYLQVIRGITQDFHHPNVRKSLLASLKAVNPTIASIELDSLTSPQRAVVGHIASGRVFELNLQQESDGFRRFYAHLLALYQTPPKLTSVFEEPENAIYPGALSLLAEEFKAAPSENRGQVIITTHNPTLLDSFDVDRVRVVEMRDGKTFVGPVSKEQAAAVKDHLLSTGELLKIDQPRIDEALAPV